MSKEKDNKKEIGWEIWSSNFYNARRFFTSKGNIKTRSKLKDKWFKEFKEDLERLVRLSRQLLK